MVMLAFMWLAVFFCADGHTDAFYLRFASPRQSSLILGTSRAAQGINPSAMNSILQNNNIYNFSFSVAHSPYGPVYLESIKRKIKMNAKNGIFILTVDPWSISCEYGNPEDSLTFRERGLALGKIKIVDMCPNIPYLIISYNQPYINLLLYKKDNAELLHENGWLEINVPMDSISVAKRTRIKIEHYKKTVVLNM